MRYVSHQLDQILEDIYDDLPADEPLPDEDEWGIKCIGCLGVPGVDDEHGPAPWAE